ncbi:hypothetical protein BDN72DRAFT_961831 [Pluteus cervinus]|uniref:Uncharacterized protein n=1 Tax=Pluteus cervinus TaxID=181527 RepID=A0ACD3AM65_9AGAR|nr:hypothetical protein BDN72DRAFT_961831 [Pluteus cervinus]
MSSIFGQEPNPFAERKSGFKLPPTTSSQEARRKKALEEQKRRRAQRFDSARQLDLFADLTLGPSDDEDEAELANPDSASLVGTQGVASFVSVLKQPEEYPHSQMPTEPPIPSPPHAQNAGDTTMSVPTRGTNMTPKKRSRKKRKANKPSKWADRCMYAELLELGADDIWNNGNIDMGIVLGSEPIHDGLPSDLETGWVAVAPVPVGKRCLAVTHQSSGVIGSTPNTTLRSRLLGKPLIPRFPSSLPALTILDCILDTNWRQNGILHVLDVVKWKGQDVADCETAFRFWWRDTRLAEMNQSQPRSSSVPSSAFTFPSPGPSFPSTSLFVPNSVAGDPQTIPTHNFPYPTTFLPVPYHTDTTLPSLYEQVIPTARLTRRVSVDVPVAFSTTHQHGAIETNSTMEVDVPGADTNSTHAPPIGVVTVETDVQPDGLLLYVAEASYEMGTSPLSSWVPISSEVATWEKDKEQARGKGKGKKEKKGTVKEVEMQSAVPSSSSTITEGPLDLFQRLVKRRLDKKVSTQQQHGGGIAQSDRLSSSFPSSNHGINDTEMET